MPNKLTRRDFLKVGTMAAAATVVSGCTVNLQRTEYLESYVLPPEEGLPGENLWYASTCRQCAAGCGIIARVSDGRARKIEGNPSHPLNRGKLCARGQAALQELYDPDRLRNAVRQAERGSQQFAPLYWEEALTFLGDRLRDVSTGKVAFLGGNTSSHLWTLASLFMDALDAPPPLAYSLGGALEGRQALARASQQLFDSPSLPVFDIANSDVVFSFGANFLETWLSPVYYSRAYGQMRRGQLGKRGYLVQFEPRLSSTAACADEWVPVRPGTEGLVALALGQIMVEEGFGGVVREMTVDVGAVAAASGVSAEVLERLARIFGGAASRVAIPGGGAAAWHDGGVAVAAVQALNYVAGPPDTVFTSPEMGVEGFAPPPVSSFDDARALIKEMASGQVKVLFVHGANPVFELPPVAGFGDALRNVPFVVSFSSTVDETAVQADLILPDHTSLEGWGYHVPAVADRRLVSGQQPVMRPLYDTRATGDVLLALAQRLGPSAGSGQAELAQALPWRNEVEFLEEMTGAWREEETSGEAFWAGWRRRGGWWSEVEERRSLPSSPAFGAALATLKAPPASEDEDEPEWLHLHVYPSISLHDGRGANKSWLQETPDPMTTVSWQTWIEINPHTAERLGVQDGDVVMVLSRVGRIEALVYVYHGIREDVVAMPAGQGHEHYGRYAQRQGSNPVQLFNDLVDGETGALAWAETRVRIVPTGRRRALARLEDAEGVEYLRGGEH